MPNIELHNFGSGDLTLESVQKLANEVNATKKRIWEALESAPYLKEVVVTEVFSASEDYTGANAAPYLRILASDAHEQEDIIERIRAIGLGIEVMPHLIRWVEPCSSPGQEKLPLET